MYGSGHGELEMRCLIKRKEDVALLVMLSEVVPFPWTRRRRKKELFPGHGVLKERCIV